MNSIAYIDIPSQQNGKARRSESSGELDRSRGPAAVSIDREGSYPDPAVESKYSLPQAWAIFLDNTSFHWNWYGHFTFRGDDPALKKGHGGFPHPEAAGKTWMLFIHKLNRESFGVRYTKHKEKGVIWARGTEYQKRGAIHYHALIGNIPDSVRRMDYVDLWHSLSGIGRIYAYEKDRGAEFYMSKSSYAWKRGEIDLSGTMKYHIPELVLPARS